MTSAKRLADPDNILAPGVLLSSDPQAHLKHLHTTPTVEGEIDRCMECGFCEPVCPSRNLTTTPRQRIVLRRDMMRQPDGSPVTQALLRDYEYDAIKTGTCPWRVGDQLRCARSVGLRNVRLALMNDDHCKDFFATVPERRTDTMVVPAVGEPPALADTHTTPLTTQPTHREWLVPSSITAGTVLEEVRNPPHARLVIESRVAVGGMRAIDVGVDRPLDRRLAVKTLHPHLRSDDSTLHMFLREARITAFLDHPHIVPVYDIGGREEEQLYFAMKFIEGQTLAAIIRSLPHGPRTATVVALEETTGLVVTSKVLEEEMAALKPWIATLLIPWQSALARSTRIVARFFLPRRHRRASRTRS